MVKMGIQIHDEINECPKCGNMLLTEENDCHRYFVECGRCNVSKEIDLDGIGFAMSKYLYEEMFERVEGTK